MKPVNLPLDSTILDYQIFHEGNHSMDKLAHPNYQSLVPIAISAPFNNQEPELNQVKIIQIKINKSQRCKCIFEVCRMGNGTTRIYSSRFTLSANTNSGTKQLKYEISRNSPDVELHYTIDEETEGWVFTFYATLVNNAERIGVIPLLTATNVNGMITYFDGQSLQQENQSQEVIPYEKTYLSEYDVKPDKIEVGEMFILNNDDERGKLGKVFVKIKNRYNGYSTVELPTSQRFIPELSTELVPTLTNRNVEDMGHIVVSQRSNEQDKLFIFLHNRNGEVESRMIQTTEYGTTDQRPKGGLSVGFQYFDLSLGKPIWYKGSGVWVNADGTEV